MTRLLAVIVVSVIGVGSAPAEADGNLENWLVGPVLGLRVGGHDTTSRLVIGFEGGGGYGPERFNLGFEHRDGKDFYYAELDPWLYVGGSLGVGIDSDGKTQPVLGLWEGVPLNGGPCDGWHTQISISGGYRYTGVHELYLSLKAGEMNGSFCLD